MTQERQPSLWHEYSSKVLSFIHRTCSTQGSIYLFRPILYEPRVEKEGASYDDDDDDDDRRKTFRLLRREDCCFVFAPTTWKQLLEQLLIPDTYWNPTLSSGRVEDFCTVDIGWGSIILLVRRSIDLVKSSDNLTKPVQNVNTES